MREDVSFASDLTPFLQAYPWVSGAGNGFGTKYADPGSLPPAECIAGSFSRTGADIVTGCYASPWIVAYPWTLGVGFGTKYTDPGSLPLTSSASNYTQFTPSGAAIIDVYATSVNPGVIAWPWTPGSGFGTAYSNPGTSPGTFPQSSAFSTAANTTSADLVITNTGTNPHLTAYPWTDASGYGTKYSDPGTIPGGTIFAAFSPNGTDVAAVRSFGTPTVYAFPWTVGVGFGTIYSNPATPPPGICRGVTFSIDGVDLVIGQSDGGASGVVVGAYPWTHGSGFGTKYGAPAANPPSGANAYCVAFSNTGGDIVSAYNGAGSPWIAAWMWSSGVGFGSKYPDPATGSGQNANATMFTPLLRGPGGALGIFGGLPSPMMLAGMALTKAMLDNPTLSRRAALGLRR